VTLPRGAKSLGPIVLGLNEIEHHRFCLNPCRSIVEFALECDCFGVIRNQNLLALGFAQGLAQGSPQGLHKGAHKGLSYLPRMMKCRETRRGAPGKRGMERRFTNPLEVSSGIRI